MAAAITYSKATSVAGGIWAGTDCVIGFVTAPQGDQRFEMNTFCRTYPKNPSDPTKNMLDGTSTPDCSHPWPASVTLYRTNSIPV